jgi:hypothetical protein
LSAPVVASIEPSYGHHSTLVTLRLWKAKLLTWPPWVAWARKVKSGVSKSRGVSVERCGWYEACVNGVGGVGELLTWLKLLRSQIRRIPSSAPDASMYATDRFQLMTLTSVSCAWCRVKGGRG